MNPTTTTRRRWFRHLVLACLLMVAGFIVYLLYFMPTMREQFDRIEIGMPLAGAVALLGQPPDLASRIKGRIEDPSTFVTNANPPADVRDLHRHYNFNQWNFTDLTIVVVTNDDSEIVCRYASNENLAPWYQRLLDAVKRGLHLR